MSEQSGDIRWNRREILRAMATGTGAYWLGQAGLARGAGSAPSDDIIAVVNPRILRTNRLPAQRIPVGIPDDYKPCIALTPTGELLMVAFHQYQLGGGKVYEDMLFRRSHDGGVTWSRPETVGLLGREPYLTVLRDGTIFITVHLLDNDVRNKDGYTHGYIHRSDDHGRTWSTTRIGPEGFPPRVVTITNRNVLEMPDGTIFLGVSGDRKENYVWRSTDRGATWDRSERCHVGGSRVPPLFFGEAVLWRHNSGKTMCIVRVDSREFPLRSSSVPSISPALIDNSDHLMVYQSADEAQTMERVDDLGDYGEMYPSVLRLQDGRLLLTFTQRAFQPHLGVRAVLGRETEEGFEFDFAHDQLILDAKTPEGKPSGGGFGPTVQLADGTLVTSYSYRTADDKTHTEVVRWELPGQS